MKKPVLGLLFAASFLAATSASAAAPGVLFEWTDRILVRDATGKAIIVEKPYGSVVTNAGPGGVRLQGGMKLSFPKTGTVPIELAKQVNRSQVVKFAKPFARAFGPIAIASLALDTIEWIDGKWQIYEEPDSIEIKEGNFDRMTQCSLLGPVGYSAYVFMENQWHLLEIVNGEDATTGNYGNNCTNLPPKNGKWPLVQFTLLEGPLPEPEEGEWREASDSELEDEIDDALANNPNKAAPIVDFGFDKGGTMDDLGGDQQTFDGPDSITGGITEKTSTGPGGTTTINEETTYNITYNNSTINITSTTTITTIHPDNSITEETTEEKNPEPDPDPEAPPESGGHVVPYEPKNPPDLVDFCKQNPRASACEELGTAGVADLLREERQVVFESEMNDAGACPDPEQLSILGFQYDLSWQPVCSFATGIRPVVIAFTFLGAGLFLFQVGRSS